MKGIYMTFLENALHYDDYFYLRQSVDWNNFSKQQTILALNHTLYAITVKNEFKTIAMGRLIGDGLYFSFAAGRKELLWKQRVPY